MTRSSPRTPLACKTDFAISTGSFYGSRNPKSSGHESPRSLGFNKNKTTKESKEDCNLHHHSTQKKTQGKKKRKRKRERKVKTLSQRRKKRKMKNNLHKYHNKHTF
mmetsp:Transcript_13860/g.21550  ORF Transcript_13860/g.21550 Transcript_13860/m.21550 type:complete len:106 (-) Transcript_13860:8-325(-)